MDGQTVSALRAVTGISVSCMISPIERGREREREREGGRERGLKRKTVRVRGRARKSRITVVDGS